MPRTLDPVAHALRRDAFVDTAQRLIQVKGYEEMSIQDVIDQLDTSKGAFYHYFDSKVDLLEAVAERIVDTVTASLAPTVDDPSLSALSKLEAIFTGIARWKTDRKGLMLALLRVWLSDENAIVREKVRQRTAIRLTPLLASIVRQGRAEDVFSATSTEPTACVLVSLLLGLNETATRLYVARQDGAISFDEVLRIVAAFTEAFERILGLDPGQWPAVDIPTLRFWFE
jgi:AcrR family transcriptional regulator